MLQCEARTGSAPLSPSTSAASLALQLSGIPRAKFACQTVIRTLHGIGDALHAALQSGCARTPTETSMICADAHPDPTSAVGPFVEQTRRPVMWLHLHKAAGTWTCKRAVAQGERLLPQAHTTTTCNTPHDGLAMLGEELPSSSHAKCCASRTSTYQQHGATWGQMERDFRSYDPFGATAHLVLPLYIELNGSAIA